MDGIISVSTHSLIYMIFCTEQRVIGLTLFFKRISGRYVLEGIRTQVVRLQMFAFTLAVHPVYGFCVCTNTYGDITHRGCPRYAHIRFPDCNQVCCFDAVKVDYCDIFCRDHIYVEPQKYRILDGLLQ